LSISTQSFSNTIFASMRRWQVEQIEIAMS
jgi:hypothetical protein